MVTISGYLMDRETGSPVPFVVVMINGSQTSSDINGAFSISVMPGSYQLKLRSSGHRPITQDLDATTDQILTLHLSRKIILPEGF